jgi:hypothetical protein
MPDPRLDELARMAKNPNFVANNVTRMRAPLKQRTMFGPAGRAVIHSPGERTLVGPNGAILCRIREDEFGGVQVEEDERLHACVRPPTVTQGAAAERPS